MDAQLNSAPSARTDRRKGAAPRIVHDVLREPGEPLERDARASMESRFGRDFSRVRVHRGGSAADSADAVGASAYTVGSNVVFGRGRFAPQTPAGSRLLAHELAHVVQQSSAPPSASALEIGESNDALEHDADRASAERSAPALSAGAAPRLQRSALGTFLSIILAPFRLLGAGGYPDEDLKDYVKTIQDKHGIEGGIFSDNKARGAVAAEKNIGPFDRETKILLIEEMLDGYTSIFDEGAIIDLLRRQSPAERNAIVQQIGRDKIWSNFSYGNRRVIEALTLTAADANAQLVSRLRDLSDGQLDDYAENAGDPAVKSVIDRVRLMKTITAPVPSSGVVAAPPPNAQLPGGRLPATSIKDTFNGVDVYALPDLIDPTLGKTQYTDLFVESVPPGGQVTTYSDGSTAVSQIDPPKITVWLRTRYAAEDTSGKGSKYGVGSEGGTLREHERSHGKDYYDYLQHTPPPAFGGQIGMTQAAFQDEVQKYREGVGKWIAEAQRLSVIKTDCANPLKRPTDADLAGTGYTASICNQR